MYKIWGGIFAFFACLHVLLAQRNPSGGSEGRINGNGVHVQGLGRSGKLRIGRNRNLESDSNALTIDFDSIREVDGSGRSVEQGGTKPHMFNTLANQQFNISRPENVTFSNIQATRIVFDGFLPNGAELTFQVFIFHEEGNITLDDEVTLVKPGAVKFNILVANWTFCGDSDGANCAGRIGRYLDVTLRVLGRRPPTRRMNRRPRPRPMPRNMTRGEEFEMGGNVTISLSRKVRIDNMVRSEDMPENFPVYETRGAIQLFRFRFRRFRRYIWYDPLVTTDDPPQMSDDSNTNAGSHFSWVTSVVALAVCFLVLIRH
ncbi:acidic skeletal organic matrix protein-like [Saccostrea cucullata]|uniref:acidic skeletal organic matrix protein-like n=1 Tax=Saccostrea cuccullata TaxID=36930 RepID=UPI002ED21B14